MLDKSARESLQTFASGKGDVLLGYENEAILAQQQGEELDYIVPDETLLIENPIAVVNESKQPEKAQAFVDFLYTKEAQEIFAGNGYRPVSRRATRMIPTRQAVEIGNSGLGQGQRRVIRLESGIVRRSSSSRARALLRLGPSYSSPAPPRRRRSGPGSSRFRDVPGGVAMTT